MTVTKKDLETMNDKRLQRIIEVEAALAACKDELMKTIKNYDYRGQQVHELEKKVNRLERQVTDLSEREYRYGQVIDKLLE